MARFGVVVSLWSEKNLRIHLAQTLAIVLTLYSMSSVATAQSTTGFPPYGTFQNGGVDIINWQNLNVHLAFPVANKPGRGLNFNYVLSYDSSVWTAVTTTKNKTETHSWVAAPNWGWRGTSEAGVGSYLFQGAVGYQGTFSYNDSMGTTHSFGPIVEYSPVPPTLAIPATDGSGYLLNVQYNYSAYDYEFENVIDIAGNTIVAPLQKQASGGSGSITDPNGNSISTTGGLTNAQTFTDTLGMTALTISESGSMPMTYTYTGPATTTYPNGTPETVTVNYSLYTVATNFGCGYTDFGPLPYYLVSSIVYPDGSTYGFQYQLTGASFGSDVTGVISQVNLPTGGSVKYTYTDSCPLTAAHSPVTGLSRQTSDGAIWQYGIATDATTVTDPALNQTVSTFGAGGVEVQRNVYQGNATSGGTLLQTTTTCYTVGSETEPCATPTGSAYPPTSITTIVQPAGGKSTQTVEYHGLTCADAIGNSTCQLNLPTEIDTYDFGATNPTQVKKITYASLTGNILNRPACVQLTVGVNSNACGTVSSSTKSLTNYSYFPRGNLEQVSSWVQGSTYLTHSNTFYPNGLLETATDVNATLTSPAYQNCNGTPAFPSSVSSGGLTTSYTWDCNGGVVTSITDANNQETTNGYVTQTGTPDPFWRVLSVTDPLKNVTWNAYTPATATTPATREMALSFPTANPTSTVDVLNTFDGLGRLTESQKRTAPGSTSFDNAVQYTYGWTSTGSITGPFSTQTIPGGTALTTSQLDALGRTGSVTDGGGGTVSMTYTQNDVLRTVGPAPTGENTKTRQLEYDALGRITSVCEMTSTLSGHGTCSQVSSSPQGYFTKYTYDSPVNTVTITQNAQGTAQTRTYQYDGLGRLTSETNPEWGPGTENYTYDTNSTCGTSNGDLVKKLDADSNVTCYAHDALHRVTGITYPSGPYSSSTPTKTFVYDATTFTCTNGANVKGRLAEAFTGPSTAKTTDEGFCYSPTGQTTDVYESTPNSGGYYHTIAAYWANGALNSLSGVPNLSATTFATDNEGRPYSATYGASTNWVKSTRYYPSNAQTTVTFGNGGSGAGDTDVYSYDTKTGRLNKYQFNVGATPNTLTGVPGWNANGTLGTLGTTDTSNDTLTQNCSYLYDDLARINSVNCLDGSTKVWNQSFTLDAFGNLSKSGSSSFAASYLLSNGTTNNREQSVGTCVPTYDANGNLTKDCTFATPATYAWDADGNPISLNGVGLTYDALDRKVEITSGSTYSQILYSPIGKLGLMNGQSASTIRIPLPGGSTAELLGTTGGTTRILHSDWLGSARLSSNYGNRTWTYHEAYAPYGESYDGSAGDLNFTGQSQDTLSGLYDFLTREYSPGQGRWISPDPAGMASVDFSNPQTWNRYAYALNNPLSNVDPTGLECVWDDGSYDSEDDPNTGSYDSCAKAGGTWVEPDYFATLGLEDWSADPNSDLAGLVNLIQNGTASATVTCPMPGTASPGQRVAAGIQSVLNIGLGELKTAGYAGVGLLAEAAAPETFGLSLLAVPAVTYGIVSSQGQVVSGVGQGYTALSGNSETGEQITQAGDIMSGPIMGVGTLAFGGSADAAQANAQIESTIMLGSGFVNATTPAQGIANIVDTGLTLAAGLGGGSCQ